MKTQEAERFPTLGDLLRQAQEARRGAAPEQGGATPAEESSHGDALTSPSPESTNRG